MEKIFAAILVGLAAASSPSLALAQQYYSGPSGMQYQYDLSKPNDAIRYSVDPSAQLRDEINVDPRRELDRDVGRFGGGAMPRY